MRAVSLLKETYSEWDKHDGGRMGAALAFYTISSLAPLVILCFVVLSFVFSQEAARNALIAQFQTMAGSDAAHSVESILQNSNQKSHGIIAGIIGLITLLLGASGVFTELRSAINRLWDVQSARQSGWKSLIKDRLFSFGMLMALGFLLLVSLLVSTALQAVGKYFGVIGRTPTAVAELLNFLASLAVITFVFALIFRYVADVRVPWRPALKGGLLTAILFTIGKTAIGAYLGKAAVGSAYGAAGSLVVLAVWVYYSAQIFYFGTEFTHLVAEPEERAQAADPVRSNNPAAGAPPLRGRKISPVAR